MDIPNISELILLGDFNCVENPSLDRFPKRTNIAEPGVLDLGEIKAGYELYDVFRYFKPTQELYTFTSYKNTFSRIDRLYTTCTMINKYCYTETKNITDLQHRLLITNFDVSIDVVYGPSFWKMNTLF